MSFVNKLKYKVLRGIEITKEEAMQLYLEPAEEVYEAANELREKLWIYVLLLMEKAGHVQKTVDIVHNPSILIQELKNLSYYLMRQ